jgi:6-phospho-3-hexuloisomerase
MRNTEGSSRAFSLEVRAEDEEVIRRKISAILSEIEDSISKVDPSSAVAFIYMIFGARRIFVTGQGRSGLIGKAFAMRLMHLGFESYTIGDPITPAVREGDLLVACSGSGETYSTCHQARAARDAGARVVAITSYPNSSLSALSDHVIFLAGDEIEESAQIGKSVFEQALLIYFDAICAVIKDKLGLTDPQILSRHANLE